VEQAAADSIALKDIAPGKINILTLSTGRKAVVLRQGAEFKVIGEICPHMGADLSQSRYCAQDRTLHCAWHGYVFSADDGRFLKNPNDDSMKILKVPGEYYCPAKTPNYRLQMLTFFVKDDRLYVGAEKEAP
jgi:nitrite reductase/ring-hydroxylating ferredoxin subunit